MQQMNIDDYLEFKQEPLTARYSVGDYITYCGKTLKIRTVMDNCIFGMDISGITIPIDRAAIERIEEL